MCDIICYMSDIIRYMCDIALLAYGISLLDIVITRDSYLVVTWELVPRLFHGIF